MEGDPLLRLFYRLAPPVLYSGASRVLMIYRPARVCDIGGGAGLLAGRLRYTPQGYVIVDPDTGLLRMAPRLPWVERVAAVAEKLPLRSDSCDAAVMVDALHHFHDPETGLDEAIRVATCLLIDDIDPGRLLGRLVKALEKLAGYPARFYAPEELLGLLEARGLEVRLYEARRGSLPLYRVYACRPRGVD